MLKLTLPVLGLLLATAGAQAGTAPRVGRTSGATPYWHALQAEARREAFWRTHPHGRSDTVRAVETMEVALRKEHYWQSQQRSRILCQSGGGCL